MMRVLQRKIVNNRQTSRTVKNQSHHVQSDFCSWSSKSTKWLLADASLMDRTTMNTLKSSSFGIQMEIPFFSHWILNSSNNQSNWVNEPNYGDNIWCIGCFALKNREMSPNTSKTLLFNLYCRFCAIFKEIGNLSNHHGGFVFVLELKYSVQSKQMTQCLVWWN